MDLNHLSKTPPLLSNAYELLLVMMKRYEATSSLLNQRIVDQCLDLVESIWMVFHNDQSIALEDINTHIFRLKLAFRLQADLNKEDKPVMDASLAKMVELERQLAGLKKYRGKYLQGTPSSSDNRPRC